MENVLTFAQNIDFRKAAIILLAAATLVLGLIDLEHPMHHHSMNSEASHETTQHVH